jgi:hypothetical protein
VNRKITYNTLILAHIGLGIVLYVLGFLSKFFGILIPIVGLVYIMRTQNKNNQVLVACSYIVGSEVLMRMTNGNVSHDLAKYIVIIYCLMGAFYSSVSKKTAIYLLFLLVLMPGVYIGTTVLNFDTNMRKAIIFNILGEITLFISVFYCYDRQIKFKDFEYILKSFALPIISILTYLFLHTPSVRDVVTGTSSNFQTSGGFGPNQVSTILGLGMFVFFALFLFFSKTKKQQLLHLGLLLIASYRGIVTFSRGGVITGLIMILVLFVLTYRYSNKKAKSKIALLIIGGLLLGSLTWSYSVIQTGGLIENRYANQDARGREKEDRLGGREKIAMTELQMFWDNPLLGIGVGKNKEFREEETGIVAASHNEVTRLLAEHGSLGILALLILILVPLLSVFENKQHLFLLPFYLFWALTINHAAMRLAAPAFIYALTLLKVNFDEEPAIHREQII